MSQYVQIVKPIEALQFVTLGYANKIKETMNCI